MATIDTQFLEVGETYRFWFLPAGRTLAEGRLRRIGQIVKIEGDRIYLSRRTKDGEEWQRDHKEIIDGVETIVTDTELMVVTRSEMKAVTHMKMSRFYGTLLDADDPDLEKK